MGWRGTAATGSALGLLAAVLLAIAALGLGYVLVQSTLATLAFDAGSSGLSSGLVGLGLFGGGGVSSAVGSLILANLGYEALWCVSAGGTLFLVVAILKSRHAFE